MRAVDTIFPSMRPTSVLHDISMGDLLRGMFNGQKTPAYNILVPATIPAYAIYEANMLGWQTTTEQNKRLGAEYMAP